MNNITKCINKERRSPIVTKGKVVKLMDLWKILERNGKPKSREREMLRHATATGRMTPLSKSHRQADGAWWWPEGHSDIQIALDVLREDEEPPDGWRTICDYRTS